MRFTFKEERARAKVHFSFVRLHVYLSALWKDVRTKGSRQIYFVRQYGLEPERNALDTAPLRGMLG